MLEGSSDRQSHSRPQGRAGVSQGCSASDSYLCPLQFRRLEVQVPFLLQGPKPHLC